MPVSLSLLPGQSAQGVRHIHSSQSSVTPLSLFTVFSVNGALWSWGRPGRVGRAEIKVAIWQTRGCLRDLTKVTGENCIGTWNVRSMNQGKLEVVKQEMARLNILDIWGISELKWTGTSEFNSDDHYIYYCGQESLRRNGVALTVNKRVWNAVLGCSLKNDRMISVLFQAKSFNIIVIEVYAPTSNAEEAEVEWFYEDLQDLPVLRPKEDVLFFIVDWNAKVGSQEIPRVTGNFGLGVQNEAGQG